MGGISLSRPQVPMDRWFLGRVLSNKPASGTGGGEGQVAWVYIGYVGSNASSDGQLCFE